MRLGELGTFGFSNDEAWVALCTRVHGFRQFWLAIAMTPVGWAALVKGVSLVHLSEAALRAVPLVFGCLTLWMAHRAGCRFAGHPLGGVLALAVIAFAPLSIAYAKVLKQYTAEAFFCLLALDCAAAFAASRSRRDLVLLAGVLASGLCFSNAQLFVAPPVLAALTLVALVRREWRVVWELVVVSGVIGLWDGGYYFLLVAPRLPAASDAYWRLQEYLPVSLDAARIGWGRLAWTVAPMLGGASALVVASVCLAAGCIQRRQCVVAAALVLLLVEIAALSMAGLVPVSQPRILLFLTTALGVFGAAAIGSLVVRAWTRPALGVLATAALVLLARDFVRAHPWRTMGRGVFVEDAGPLVRLVEGQRRPDDAVLLHTKTLFIYGFYQRAVPVLDRFPGVSTGYLPRLTDPRVVLVEERTLAANAERALRSGGRAWLLASRLRREDEMRLRRLLERFGPTVREERRRGAFMVLVEPPPSRPSAH